MDLFILKECSYFYQLRLSHWIKPTLSSKLERDSLYMLQSLRVASDHEIINLLLVLVLTCSLSASISFEYSSDQLQNFDSKSL